MRKQSTYSKICFTLYTLLFVIPVILVLSNITGNSLREMLSSDYFRRIMLFTLSESSLSTVISLMVGFPAALILTRTDFKLKKTVKAFLSMPFALPSVIAVLAFVIFWGNNGYANRILMALLHSSQPPMKILYSFKAVIMAHVFYNAPVFTILLSDSLASVDADILNAAKCDGADNVKIFFKIKLPQCLSSIASTSCLVFLFCFTSFAIIMILGGNIRYTTAEVEIYRLARTDFNIPGACSLALFSMLTTIAVLSLMSIVQKKKTVRSFQVKHEVLRKPTSLESILLAIYILFLAVPLISVFFSAAGLQSIPLTSVLNTTLIGIVSSVIGNAVAVGIALELDRKNSVVKDVFSMLPMAVSSVVLGLSYFVVSKYITFVPQVVFIVLVHSMLIMPFALRTILPALRLLPSSFRNEAMIEGATDYVYCSKVLFPVLKKPLVSSLLYGFAISCGELNSTLIFSGGSVETLPVLIQRQMGSYNFSGACAAGSVLIVMCFLFYLASYSTDKSSLE